MSAPSGAAASTRPRHIGTVLCLLAFAQLIIAVDYNIVFVALPEIGNGLRFSEYTLQWVVSAYAVAFGGFLLLGGRAADLCGRRRMFVLGLILYALSSSAGGLANEPYILILARAVQGVGGAFLAPATLSFITTLFAEGRERNRALSVWGAAGSTGMVVGSLLGGALTQALGWQSVFFVNVLFAGVGVVLAYVLIPADDPRMSTGNFDVAGALSATGAGLLLVFSLAQGPSMGWGSPATLINLGLSALLLGIFLVVEARRPDPLMPLALFRNRNLSAGTVVTFLFMATFGAIAYFLTLYFQGLRGYTALNTGYAFVLPCVCVLVGTVIGGRLVTRFGIRAALIIALVPGAVGAVWLAHSLSETGSYLAIAPALIVLSIGQGIAFTTGYAAVTTGVPAKDQGIASGIATTGQQVGGAVGLAVLVATTSALVNEPAESLTSLRTATYAIAVGVSLMLLVAFIFRPPSDDDAVDLAVPRQPAKTTG